MKKFLNALILQKHLVYREQELQDRTANERSVYVIDKPTQICRLVVLQSVQYGF